MRRVSHKVEGARQTTPPLHRNAAAECATVYFAVICLAPTGLFMTSVPLQHISTGTL